MSFINESTLPTNYALARLHSLDGGQRQIGGRGQCALVHADERAGRSQLRGGNHALCISIDV